MPQPLTPEQHAREQIDDMLRQAGWAVQNVRQISLTAATGVAVRELSMKGGTADYALFVSKQLVGIIEAKRVGTTLGSVEAQTRAYASGIPNGVKAPITPLPFLYESTGVETWFSNGLDPEPRARRVFWFHRPETLQLWLDDALKIRKGLPAAPVAPTLIGRMRHAPPLYAAGMRPPQITAIQNLERSVCEGRPRALVQMATGVGKTFTAVSALYRLIKEGGARRALFLVDRGNLGRQAEREFQGFSLPDDGRKFSDVYTTTWLRHNQIDPVNKVVITTIQRLYSVLSGAPSLPEDAEEGSGFLGDGPAILREPPPVTYNPLVPPDLFDVVVVDECHRSIYTLWRQVIEYFDASIIGLTATPAKHTYAFFNGNVVSEYRHEQAVRDRVNVPYQVYELRTRVSEEGGTIIAEPQTAVARRDRSTRKTTWEALDEDVSYPATALDRSVVVPDQIRTVLRALRERMFTEIFPGRSTIPKTLFYAKSDDHAEDILRILREEWALSNEQAVKITYKTERDGAKGASRKPEDLITAFKNSPTLRVAITVDMIATGTDIRALECVVFMRSVRSRVLLEQMKGRGVRTISDDEFQALTPDALTKTHFVLVDCVGVMEDTPNDPPMDRDPSLSLEKLLKLVAFGDRDPGLLSTLAARLDRLDRIATSAQQAQVVEASEGLTLRQLVADLINSLDDDHAQAKACEMFHLAPGTTPTDAQRQAAQEELREAAVAPLAYIEPLREAVLAIRRDQDLLIDTMTTDELTRVGRRADLELDYDHAQAIVSGFQTFCLEQRDQYSALRVLFSRPYAQRLTRAELRELVNALERPPRQWTREALWAAYERVEEGRVRGKSKGAQLTDLISLVRHAMGLDAELVAFAEQAEARFQNWLATQSNRGRTFTPEQLDWLRLIKERLIVDMELTRDDLDDTPFIERGGLGQAHRLFGEELDQLVEGLTMGLVA